MSQPYNFRPALRKIEHSPYDGWQTAYCFREARAAASFFARMQQRRRRQQEQQQQVQRWRTAGVYERLTRDESSLTSETVATEKKSAA